MDRTVSRIPNNQLGALSSPKPAGKPATRFDAVIVGARVAGAATAMLLAQKGLRVLAIDRDGYRSDTTSSHALMRGAVTQLERWGIAPSLRAVTPDINTVTFHYGDRPFPLEIVAPGQVAQDGPTPLMAPRRTVLDATMVDAAAEAGAEIRHRTRMLNLHQHPSGRVTGLRLADDQGREFDVSADVVIGADGLRSAVARQVEAPITRQGIEASPYVLRYVEDLGVVPGDQYQWLYRPGISAGFIPTVDGQFAIFAGTTRERFRGEIRTDVAAGFQRVLDEIHPEFGEATRQATKIGRPRSWPGVPGQFRKAFGPGWALVGDAGYFKDPAAAHGISDALRDAELLAEAVVTGDYATYENTRDELSTPLFEVLEQIASYRWTMDELPAIHLALGKAMSTEQKALARIWSDRASTASQLPLLAAA